MAEHVRDAPIRVINLPANKRPPVTFKVLLLCYLIIVLVPYFLGLTQDITYRGWYTEAVTVLSIAGLAMMLAQFALSGRFDTVTSRTGVDNGMSLHRKVGLVLAVLFFLHPLLIFLPRVWIAPVQAYNDFLLLFKGGLTDTGLYAWCMLMVWVLTAVYRDKIGMKYEAWRISHGLGAVAIIILATHHAYVIGRHGHYDRFFDVMWWTLCAIAVSGVAYGYFIRPLFQCKRPFKLVSCEKAGRDDWCLTVAKDGNFDLKFDAGQFVWINTTGNPFNRAEHPFSIASSPLALPKISFIIRELGDFTRNLDKLKPGQRIYLDGPHGAFTLAGRNASGIALIAGGAGIGPILGILRQLRDLGDKRPVRMIYGNRTMDQMVFQEEIEGMSDKLDFEQTLTLENPPDDFTGHKGYIDPDILSKVYDEAARKDWDFYVCGPPVMIHAVRKNLKHVGVPAKKIIYEQLAF